ncbi:COBRA-like protein 7 [Curcuma longa]|uniref:COBRA-like protein 7 n=1 Tax=Curcuma longa TaxID=136217 RepID=UPI003D9EEB13
MMDYSRSWASVLLFLLVFLLSAESSWSDRTRPPSIAAAPELAPTPAPALAPAPDPSPESQCNGIYLSYFLEQRERIHPITRNPADQPYSFRATATVLNHGTADLVSWTLLVPFRHDELLVSIDGGVLANGSASALPYNTTIDANVTAFSGYPNTDLKTPIETANDLTLIQAKISLVGTLFGAPPPAVPLPEFLDLGDPSYSCAPFPGFNGSGSVDTCCLRDPNYVPKPVNVTGYLDRRSGDLTIAYDVLQSFETNYLALVTIENHNPVGRLDHWDLSWEWARGEFISSMRGAYPTVVDSSDCIFGKQGQHYKDFDFTKVLSCKQKPVISDLTPWQYNDTNLGRIPHCCRNGSLLPPEMDQEQSVSAFQIQVYKMMPDLNRSVLFPPVNWNISGSGLNPDYRCGQPIRVSPAQFPDPSGLDSESLALASWQVVCNITRPRGTSPKCCVSFSAFYNDSVVPCNTCACGCSASNRTRACNATAQAMLLPPEALLVPFDNRTEKTLAWAHIKHYDVPSPLPCADNCGVSINWHVVTNYEKGWSARVTLFNWREDQFADWFMAAKMEKAYPGFEQMYSFNGTKMGNDTIFMVGMPGLNYINGETNGTRDGDPRVPGKQQSVISFTKKLTPGIDILAGDGYPSKVYFNGEECSMPDMIPTSWAFRTSRPRIFTALGFLLLAASLVSLELM